MLSRRAAVFDDRLQEHNANTVKDRLSGDLLGHLREYHRCKSIFAKTEVLYEDNNLWRRLLKEPVEIAARGHTVEKPILVPVPPIWRFLRV